MRAPWNHNIQYHDLVIRAIPAGCRRALDVGCGEGLLIQRFANHAEEAVGIDLDPATLDRARGSNRCARITFVHGDVMSHPFPENSFDFIAAVATLHHVPLRPGLARFRQLLAPGGTLAVIGLRRAVTLQDYVWSAIAFPSSWIVRCVRGYQEVAAPTRDPNETLREIRDACAEILPGAILQRRLFFRYSLIWTKP